MTVLHSRILYILDRLAWACLAARKRYAPQQRCFAHLLVLTLLKKTTSSSSISVAHDFTSTVSPEGVALEELTGFAMEHFHEKPVGRRFNTTSYNDTFQYLRYIPAQTNYVLHQRKAFASRCTKERKIGEETNCHESSLRHVYSLHCRSPDSIRTINI